MFTRVNTDYGIELRDPFLAFIMSNEGHGMQDNISVYIYICDCSFRCLTRVSDKHDYYTDITD